MSGRPIRFLGATVVGWVAVRAVLLWPAAGPAAIPRALVPAAFADSGFRATAPSSSRSVGEIVATPWQPRIAAPAHPARSIAARVGGPVAATAPTMPAFSPGPVATAAAATRPQSILAPPAPTPATASAQASRWSASAWFVLRDGRGIAPDLSGGQLGGSQAGLRVAYAIDQARRVAVVGRAASPLEGLGREASVGIEWRPTALPVRLVAEYRLALDGGASGPAAGVIAGTGPAPLVAGFDLETYGQAGVIRRRRAEPFAEGAARLSRRVLSLGTAKIDLGLGSWGGAQRGAQRLDIGPSLGLRIPVAGTSIRASLDWRQRVAGHARPGSGPVLAIGSDF